MGKSDAITTVETGEGLARARTVPALGKVQLWYLYWNGECIFMVLIAEGGSDVCIRTNVAGNHEN